MARLGGWRRLRNYHPSTGHGYVEKEEEYVEADLKHLRNNINEDAKNFVLEFKSKQLLSN